MGLLTLAAMLAMASSACDRRPATVQPDGKLAVTVTVAPHAWLVRRLSGDRLDVLTMVQPADSPDTYLPTDAQLTQVMASALYFRVGVPCESSPWFSAIATAKAGPRIVDLRQGITLRRMAEHADHDSHGTAGDDPHIWLAPPLLKIQAQTVARSLTEIDPGGRQAYADRLAELIVDLDQLDAQLRARLAPLAGRRFYVDHPAWGYFADAYGLVQVSVEVEGKKPSEHEITLLVQQMRGDGARVIFIQPQFAASTAIAIADAIGAKTTVLDPVDPHVLDSLSRAAELIATSLE